MPTMSEGCEKTQQQGTTDSPSNHDRALAMVAIDMVGPLSRTRKQYVLTLMDYGSRYPEALPLKNTDSQGGYIPSIGNSRRNPLRPVGEFHFQIDARPLQALGSQANKNITLSTPDKWSH